MENERNTSTPIYVTRDGQVLRPEEPEQLIKILLELTSNLKPNTAFFLTREEVLEHCDFRAERVPENDMSFGLLGEVRRTPLYEPVEIRIRSQAVYFHKR